MQEKNLLFSASQLPGRGVPCDEGNHFGVLGLRKEAEMSQRHRNQDLAPAPRADLRAHAHNERHRVNSELHLVVEAVQHGTDALDVIEPGMAWKPVHHHDAEIAKAKSRRKPLKHWKTKDWKRRNSVRRARAQAWNALA